MTALYLASAYQNRRLIEDHRLTLAAHGYRVVSTWHTHQLDAFDAEILSDACAKAAAATAQVDLHEIAQCDTLLCVMVPGVISRGGAHFETGVAFALHKHVVVIGAVAHVFHRLPAVQVHADLATWLRAQEAHPRRSTVHVEHEVKR